MEQLKQSTEVISLGNKIAKELEIKGGILDRWMAFYIAELISKIECADGDEKKKLEKECFEIILRLWERRYNLDRFESPLEDIRDTIKVLDQLKDKASLDFGFGGYFTNQETNWSSFVKKFKDSANEIIGLSVLHTTLKDNSLEKHNWIDNYGSLLDLEEKEIIERLNNILFGYNWERIGDPKIELIENLNSNDRKEAVFLKIKVLLDEINLMLESLSKM